MKEGRQARKGSRAEQDEAKKVSSRDFLRGDLKVKMMPRRFSQHAMKRLDELERSRNEGKGKLRSPCSDSIRGLRVLLRLL